MKTADGWKGGSEHSFSTDAKPREIKRGALLKEFARSRIVECTRYRAFENVSLSFSLSSRVLGFFV